MKGLLQIIKITTNFHTVKIDLNPVLTSICVYIHLLTIINGFSVVAMTTVPIDTCCIPLISIIFLLNDVSINLAKILLLI